MLTVKRKSTYWKEPGSVRALGLFSQLSPALLVSVDRPFSRFMPQFPFGQTRQRRSSTPRWIRRSCCQLLQSTRVKAELGQMHLFCAYLALSLLHSYLGD